MNRKTFALAAVVVALAVGIAWVRVDDSSPSPSSRPSTSGSDAPAGERAFVAPGISFTYPAGWVDRTALADQATWTYRTVAELIDGPPACPQGDASAANPTPRASLGCYASDDGPPLGSLSFAISEWLRPVPGEFLLLEEADTMIGSRPAMTQPDGSTTVVNGTTVENREWVVSGPDGGIYSIWVRYPVADSAIREPQVDSLVATIEFSDWTPPDPADGTAPFVVLGFSATVPTGWHAYSFAFPRDSSAGDDVAMLASTELEPCEPPGECHQNNLPEGILVDFYNRSCVVGCPDWTDANALVGGQPAIHTTAPVRRGVEREYWTVDGGEVILLVSAYLRGPDKDELRPALADLIASMELLEPLPTP